MQRVIMGLVFLDEFLKKYETMKPRTGVL